MAVKTVASIIVLANDDPQGVFEFATNSLQVSVAEDYKSGFINDTYANLTVLRKKGHFGTVAVSRIH